VLGSSLVNNTIEHIGFIMPSHSELAAKLLRDAAAFFKTISEQNPPLKDQMDENADVFEQVADLVEKDPNGIIEEQ
jgi:hypothetical protein